MQIEKDLKFFFYSVGQWSELFLYAKGESSKNW